ncbi:response regulator transcription factor [Streptomyces sp. V4I23]|uniref:helix-turn-helix transcriptional regulator n=1 Tax=Streptomyces sp. V4I23 TaxID=3042282 RepID=UPI0027D79B6C|nr:response regulator transcription factor [Streptomyces sp. V4I23]
MEDADRVALDVLRTMSRSHARGIFIVSRRWYIDLHTAVDCGLRGVIWRSEFTPAKFISTITAVGQGGADLPPDLQGKLLDEVQRMRRDVLAPHRLIDPCLTEREIAVLRLVADGCTLAEITSQLPYSERTVKHVLHNVMRLLNVRNRAHAVSYAVRAGLI